jgi:hypothetical protein
MRLKGVGGGGGRRNKPRTQNPRVKWCKIKSGWSEGKEVIFCNLHTVKNFKQFS